MSRQFRFAPDPGGGSAGDVRLMFVVYTKATLRPGAVRARDAPRTPLGWQPILACRNGKRAADGRRHLLLRAQRVLKEGKVIRKRRGNHPVPSPLVRSAAAQAASPPGMRGHPVRPVQADRPPRAAALPPTLESGHTSPYRAKKTGQTFRPAPKLRLIQSLPVPRIPLLQRKLRPLPPCSCARSR